MNTLVSAISILQHHSSDDLIHLFNRCYAKTYRTSLVGGADEPLYMPGNESREAKIYFRENFFSSALHEIAHWCIAGEQRLSLVDYGYWYIADGREQNQQAAFFDAEVKPQALEWVFSELCQYQFSVSVDNTNYENEQMDWSYWEQLETDKKHFKQRCFSQIEQWMSGSFPSRAIVFMEVLELFYRPEQPLQIEDFMCL